jgi:hypothetical protein
VSKSCFQRALCSKLLENMQQSLLVSARRAKETPDERETQIFGEHEPDGIFSPTRITLFLSSAIPAHTETLGITFVRPPRD